MKRNIFVSLMLAFLFATTFSSVLSFSISSLVNRRQAIKEIRADEMIIARNYISFAKQGDTDGKELAEKLSTSMYLVKVMTEDEYNRLSGEQRKYVERGEAIIVSHINSIDTECIFSAYGNIVCIRLNESSNILSSYGVRIGIILSMTLLFSAVIMFFAGKSVTEPILEIRDATQRVAKGDFDVQVEIDTKNTDIAQLSRSFNSMVKELKSNEVLKKDFVSNVSHEFKTPLATISGFAKLLEDGNLSEEETVEYASIIKKECDRLTVLCSNVLRLSRIENQKITTNKAIFRLDEQIRDAIVLFEPLWDAKELILDVDLDEAEYYGDEELLQQVWINLVQNAIKFTPEKGTITVYLRKNDNGITVNVADTGIGMSEEVMKHIFEKFYQAEASRSNKGNGLGLALVKEIVELSGGRVNVTSEVGKGSNFTVILPETDETID